MENKGSLFVLFSEFLFHQISIDFNEQRSCFTCLLNRHFTGRDKGLISILLDSLLAFILSGCTDISDCSRVVVPRPFPPCKQGGAGNEVAVVASCCEFL